MLFGFWFLPFLLFLLTSCGNDAQPKPHQGYSQEDVKNLSKDMGEWDAQRQKDEIDMYMKNHGWEMSVTGTGLRYMYTKKGTGAQAKNGSRVLLAYKIYLLDGTLCYSSETKGPKEVVVGHDNVETGLHEALQMMRVGDAMRLILPSHLAFGLTGDHDRIPPRASVMYEIEMLDLKEN